MENKTNNFFNSFIENKKQKFIAIVYVILLFLNWWGVNIHNSDLEGACITNGHDCHDLFTTSLIITIIFLVITLMCKSKKHP